MSAYNRKALLILAVCGTLLCVGAFFCKTLCKWSYLSGGIAAVSLLVLLVGTCLGRQTGRSRRKQAGYSSAMPDDARQALRIIRGQEDGHRHYESLSPEQRRKSIFGGKHV